MSPFCTPGAPGQTAHCVAKCSPPMGPFAGSSTFSRTTTPAAAPPGRRSLGVNIERDLGLQDEPVREEKVVRGLQLGSKMALAAHKAGDFEIEKIRGEALNAERRPVAGGT